MQKPIILLEGHYSEKEIKSLRDKCSVKLEKDIYEDQLGELFEVNNPTLKFSPNLEEQRNAFIQTHKKRKSTQGNWIYLPWCETLMHTVIEEQHNLLRTNRNKNLITKEEQKTLYESCVAFAGLSIGSSVAITLAYQAIAKNMKFADFDTLETTNLNRIRAGLRQIGDPKIKIAAEQIYEINPYANLTLFENGITDDSLSQFLTDNPKPKIVLDAIDDLKMKIKLRLKARELGICVVMFTNLGDGMLIDIERYDVDNKLALFNGRIGDVPEKILSSEITKQEENKYVISLVGMENIPHKALESLQQIGKTLVGRPQLASTVTVTGGIGTFIFRQILLGNEVKSGRKLVKFDDTFLP